MKRTLKKTCLLGLSLLLAFSVVGIIGVTNSVNGEGVTIINTNPSDSDLHWPSLFSLYLIGEKDVDSWMNVVSSSNFLSVLNGLIVGKNHSADNSQLVVIGGGTGNTISANNAGIGGGQGNTISANNAGIGGGQGNNVVGNGGVVVGGITNKAGENGVVAGGGYNNYDNRGIVLGGKNNRAGVNSLVLGQGANGVENSFAWNGEAAKNAARIQANNGVLIGTYENKQGIALVVSGAVKLGNEENPDVKGEINVDSNGCVRFDDGGSKHVLGKTSESKCGAGDGCQFGTTKLQNGETISKTGDGDRDVKAYEKPYAKNCTRVSVTCNTNGTLSREAYPYCYTLSDDNDPTNSVIN